MSRRLPRICLLMTLLPALAAAENHLQTEQQRFSYTLGVQMARNLLNQAGDLDRQALLEGIRDILEEQGLDLTPEEMRQVVIDYRKSQQAERQQSASENRQRSEAFLEENSGKDGVVSLPSGVQYQVLREGDGEQPAQDDNVRVHYEGRTIDGNVFDSSYQRGQPVDLNLQQVIEGWQIALPLMAVGSKWELYIPSRLAYGAEGAGAAIGPNEALIFTVELLAIN